ncbi:hypothetical protein [Lentisalinibacter orientalis]|uniref:hypothetical protein n=1 Tax=Lentisalinibacter orientalis TaxID=2992241 RepID=UPI0038636AF1
MINKARSGRMVGIGFGVVALLAAAAIFHLYSSFLTADEEIANFADRPAASQQQPQPKTYAQPAASNPNPQSAEADRELAPNSVATKPQIPREEAEKQYRWEAEHGYVYTSDEDYRLLSDAELEQLTVAGDVAAMQQLAVRSMLKRPEEALELYRQAAIHGSTYALIAIADTWRLHATSDTSPKSTIGEENPYVNALTYTFTAQLRGNNTAAGTKASEIVTEGELSREQVDNACGLAKGILRELSTERQRIGLPQFDNSPSPSGISFSNFEYTCRE